MPRQSISGFSNHPLLSELEEYSPNAPIASWRGRLDYLAWGKSTNLFCFFTDIENNSKYRISVFSRSSYKPYKGNIAFDQEPAGGIFLITTSETKKGNIKFENAEKI